MANERKITGLDAFYNALEKQILATKTRILILTPTCTDRILGILAEAAFNAKQVKFEYVTNFNMQSFKKNALKLLKVLGNFKLRQFEKIGLFWGINRDDLEVIFGSGDYKTMDLVISQDPADIVRINTKYNSEITPFSKIIV